MTNTACLTCWAFVFQCHYLLNVLLFPTNVNSGLSRALAKTRESNFNCRDISIKYERPYMVVEMVQIQHFKIIFIFNIYSFIFNICIYSALIIVQNSTPIFIFNSSICSQNYHPFRNYLSIQQTFYSFKIYCASLLRGQRRSASDHWNFEKYTDRFCTEFSEERLRRSEHLRLCLITFPTMFHRLFANISPN